MAVKRAVFKAVAGQFGRPWGAAGQAAGWVMAHRSSNRQRNRWVVSLLDVRPADRVLEIGFGPGLAIAELSRRISESGHVYGIDHSGAMLGQAARRNAAAIRAGRITLTRASVDQLPPALGGRADAVLAVDPGARTASRPGPALTSPQPSQEQDDQAEHSNCRDPAIDTRCKEESCRSSAGTLGRCCWSSRWGFS